MRLCDVRSWCWATCTLRAAAGSGSMFLQRPRSPDVHARRAAPRTQSLLKKRASAVACPSFTVLCINSIMAVSSFLSSRSYGRASLDQTARNVLHSARRAYAVRIECPDTVPKAIIISQQAYERAGYFVGGEAGRLQARRTRKARSGGRLGSGCRPAGTRRAMW